MLMRWVVLCGSCPRLLAHFVVFFIRRRRKTWIIFLGTVTSRELWDEFFQMFGFSNARHRVTSDMISEFLLFLGERVFLMDGWGVCCSLGPMGETEYQDVSSVRETQIYIHKYIYVCICFLPC